jgi:phenylalanyl-tRNA synthetase beta subunit
LADGLKDSLKLNKINSPLLGMKEVKIFQIGTIFLKDKEEMHVAYNEKDKIIEKTLEEFSTNAPTQDFLLRNVNHSQKHMVSNKEQFNMWSLFPFIARDVAVWVPEGVTSEDVEKVIRESMGDLVIKGPELFDEFKKEGKTSYAFKLVFQSYDRTLTDTEINEIMTRITEKIKENTNWQVR